MVVSIIVIDFETKDPYLDCKLGAGWVYKVNDPNSDFEVLGAAVRFPDGKTEYIMDLDRIIKIANEADGYIMHNATYDLGCLIALGVDISEKRIFDTMVMGKFYNSILSNYKLDYLAKRYVGIGKDAGALLDAIWNEGIYKQHKDTDKRKVRKRPSDALLLSFSYKHMKEIQEVRPDLMARYAIADVVATWELAQFFKGKIDMVLAEKYSGLAKLCCKYRQKGVRVDLKKLEIINEQMKDKELHAHLNCYKIAGYEFDVDSPSQTAAALTKAGVQLPKTDAGNLSCRKDVLEAITGSALADAVLNARRIKKHRHDFIDKPLHKHVNGRVFPELNLLGARTGRFSSSNPNIQNIPSRDEEYGPLCRSVFLPEEGEKWFSLDFSNQEGRLQVHYAHMAGAKGAAEFVAAFIEDPNLDMHQMVADMAGITRSDAKVLNLGISYGMGLAKIAKSLGVNEVAAKRLLGKYYKLAPYLKELNKTVQYTAKSAKYIKTLGGRHLTYNEDKPYIVLNQLIQGSAADQTIEAMIQADKEGILILFPVHDQVCFSGTKEQAIRMKEIMETCVDLYIPSVVDVDLEGGDNWADAGH